MALKSDMGLTESGRWNAHGNFESGWFANSQSQKGYVIARYPPNLFASAHSSVTAVYFAGKLTFRTVAKSPSPGGDVFETCLR